jgi:hypothetical protein
MYRRCKVTWAVVLLVWETASEHAVKCIFHTKFQCSVTRHFGDGHSLDIYNPHVLPIHGVSHNGPRSHKMVPALLAPFASYVSRTWWRGLQRVASSAAVRGGRCPAESVVPTRTHQLPARARGLVGTRNTFHRARQVYWMDRPIFNTREIYLRYTRRLLSHGP